MKHYGIGLSVLVFTAIFILLAAPATATENKLYFVPDNSNVSGYGDYVDVDIYTDINESNPASSGQFNIEYDPNDVENYPSFAAAVDWDTVTYSNAPGICYFTTSVGLNPAISGHFKVGTLTLRSNTTCGGCFLNFTDASYTGGVVPEIDDGTFLSGGIIEITKTIWDESTSSWVDAIGPLDSSWMGQDVRFRIIVTAGSLDMSGLVIEDVMDSSLLYNNNATPAETSCTNHTATWNIGSLSASTSTSIEFNATIDGYGTSVNTATATAGVIDLGLVEVSATDQASVTTMPPAGIDVTKTVWDGTAWVEEITGATIGDTYRFRCEMENSGSPGMDLTDIEVWDIISPGLEYANSAMIMTPNGVWRSIEPPTSITTYDPVDGTTVNWTIDDFLQDPLTLQPGQVFVVEYNTTVINYGYYCNVQYASGYCEAALSYVEGSDTACINTPEPDMTVTDITVNYDASGVMDLAIGPLAPGTKTQSNNISANITEVNGIDIILPFKVTFDIEGVPHTVMVPSLAAGATTTVYCDSQFFPIAGNTYTITVIADSDDDIPETNESNNNLSETLTAIVNGYTGDGWQDGRDISGLPCYEQGTINLTYSTGDSYYLSGYYNKWDYYEAHWTPADLNIPPTDSCIKMARLYAYYHSDQYGDKWENLTMDFNGHAKTPVAHYSDEKGFGSWDYTSNIGSLVYDVTNEFMVTSNNTAFITNSNPNETKGISMEGMLLMVVYNNTETEPERIIWINEGCDLISSKYAKYGVSPEEATAYAPFSGCEPIPMNEVVDAKLITVAQIGNQGDDKNRLYFNGGEWHGLFPDGYVSSTNLGIHEADVRSYLTETDNVATYQDNGDMFAPANAFLVVTTAEGQIEVVAPDECIGVTEQFDVMINITPTGTSVYGVEYELNFNSSVIHAEWQNEGDFLKQDGATTNVYINTIDNSAGKVTFAATRTNTETGVTEPGTVATIHFTAMQMGASTDLTLSNVKVSDPEAQKLSMEIFTDTAHVCDNVPPVAAAECLFKYNNVGTKYISKTYFDGSASTDDGSITNYRWYFGDGNYGAGETYDYVYGSWNWNGASYDPFEVILTVEDDGTPMMDNSTIILVNVYIAGDGNGDGEVDIFDATLVGLEWGHTTTDNWSSNERGDKADLNNDGEVDIFDAVIIGANWGHTA
ncbi:MAG: DUF3344 domain-containing protein [Methanosarcinaceae archaeon]